MVHKLALFAASLVAALTLAVALAVAGFAPAGPGSAPTAPTAAQAADDATSPPVQVDKVYVAAPPPQQTVTIHKVVGSSGENEAEAGD